MGIVIGVIVLIVAIGIIRGFLSVKNEPDLDEFGNMRCKGCGNSSFTYWKNNDGSTTFECNLCGKRWTRF